MLLDEIKRPEGIEAATYGRHNNAIHDEIAKQMAEWEKSHKVTVIPIGHSSEHKPLATEQNLKSAHANSKGVPRPRKKYREPHQPGVGAFIFDNLTKQKPKKSASGHQNLKHVRDDLYAVQVAKRHVGIFPLAEALEVRNRCRESMGMQPAQDCV